MAGQLNFVIGLMTDDGLLIVPVPSLVATLLNRERAKGTPLTQEEVNEIRDACPARAMTPEQLDRVEERRGYTDIDPERAWEEWLEVKKMFDDLPGMV